MIDILLPENANYTVSSRISIFMTWLNETGRPWYDPDLGAFRDFLLRTHESSSVQSMLSTIRGRYREVINDSRISYWLKTEYPLIEEAEALKCLVGVCNSENSSIKTPSVQDWVASGKYVWLTVDQVNTLLSLPDTSTLMGLRDKYLIALALNTGLREAELCNLRIHDLRITKNEHVGVHVRRGKGSVARMIPYGECQTWILALSDQWIEMACIKNGPVFRGLWKGGKRVRDSKLTTKGVQKILNTYKDQLGDIARYLSPHDLRRTYARRCYELGMDIYKISLNLGSSLEDTCHTYIGRAYLEARKYDSRNPPSLYQNM